MIERERRGKDVVKKLGGNLSNVEEDLLLRFIVVGL